MNDLSVYEKYCYYKTLCVALGGTGRATISKQEYDTAVEVLKKMADNRWDWTEEQKQQYKLLADYLKETFKG
ncbi:hypothetical protein SAMN02910447_03511 [Ruminococcus sp. YE71]|uniref:hypothetical protein n=1 Tax=unclassified Ruminococcus TaxID=2608920 RepID=UPI000891BB61|nr:MULTISPECIES: hypothetical protein [unclassified Ruminococcus]SDA32321.1 hypothetical protein SAMN02910446_03577 [Ruminococcus sp. YE78]SFW53194.1 hypothetical protein SAMN02910447_03511 [Ruminococcus sp. YE71]